MLSPRVTRRSGIDRAGRAVSGMRSCGRRGRIASAALGSSAVTSAATSPPDRSTEPAGRSTEPGGRWAALEGRWAVLVGLRPAMSIWWASRLALFVVVSLTSYVLALPGPTRINEPGGWLLERFVWWDAFHFLRIADRGYLPPGLSCCDQAFFPGYPLSIRAFAPLVGSSVLAVLLVTQLAASIAMWLLWRMATESAQW